jgi:hypothetical protein
MKKMPDDNPIYDNPKLPLFDKRYQIAPGTYSLSAWSRENEPKEPPRFRVGGWVLSVQISEITAVYQDCDGTPLYALDNKRGYSDYGLIKFVSYWKEKGGELLDDLLPEFKRLAEKKLKGR